MDFLANLGLGFSVALTPFNLLMAVAGVVMGILIGALPGIGPPSGVALLLPLTFGMSPTSGIIMLAALYAGTMYGGTITSVLINTPGESASVVTCIDGYQMALQGRAGPALGIAAIGSFFAGTVGVVLLMLISPVSSVTVVRPSSIRAKVSGGPNASDQRASSGETSISRTTPTVPAQNEPSAAMPSAGPARPCSAIW